METYITFGQTPVSLEGYQQVPCFSNALHSSTAAMAGPPPAPAAAGIMPLKNIPAHVGGLPEFAGSGLSQLDCDQKVIRTVLNHLTKLEGNQKRDPPTFRPW